MKTLSDSLQLLNAFHNVCEDEPCDDFCVIPSAVIWLKKSAFRFRFFLNCLFKSHGIPIAVSKTYAVRNNDIGMKFSLIAKA